MFRRVWSWPMWGLQLDFNLRPRTCWSIERRCEKRSPNAGGSADMNKQTTCNRSDRGVALIMALLMILVLGILAAAVMFTSEAQAWTGLNFRLTAQSRYAAEAGLQSTMNWLSSASYAAPTTFTSYDMTKNPVQYNGNPVVLSAMSGVSSNYPDAAADTAYSQTL